jgi:hypothetical protein
MDAAVVVVRAEALVRTESVSGSERTIPEDAK